MKDLDEKVAKLEERVEATAKIQLGLPASPSKEKSCKECDETFSRNFELETHMVTFHGREKEYSCEVCGKKFFLKWRLGKHSSIHEESTKPCKYVQAGNACPFAEVGCKFDHNIEDKEVDEEAVEEDQSQKDDELENNFCYFCDIMFRNQGELIAHMGDKHLDLFPHIQQANSLITF